MQTNLNNFVSFTTSLKERGILLRMKPKNPRSKNSKSNKPSRDSIKNLFTYPEEK